MPELPEKNRTLVLGLGNTLLGDEGAGVYAVRALQEKYEGLADVEFLDGGTLSFTLAGSIEEAGNLIQAVVPSTWNAGPRDAAGKEGPYEAALKGHRLHDPKQPIEILRTIHSFDPCIACAVHVTDPEGEELIKVKIR